MSQKIKFYKTYDVKKISQCHQSVGPSTISPRSRLDRWGGINSAIIDWLFNDANDEIAVKTARGKSF